MKIGKKFISIRPLTWGVTSICLLLLAACSVSYKFNGASIDYSKVHTIQIADFPIRSTYVWGPMGPMRFTNNTNHSQDFERQFTATSSYENVRSLNSVQEELVTQMVKDLTDQIFNATVANW